VQSSRLGAQELEECVIGILVDALTSQAGLLERLGTPGAPSGEIRRLLGRAAGLTALLCSSSGERAKVVRELVEQVIVDEKRIIIKLQRGPLLGEGIPSEDAAGEPSGRTIELTAAVDFKRRGLETKLVPPGLAQQNQSSRGDPALIKAIARGARMVWGARHGSRPVPPRSWHSVTASPGATSGASLASPF
jgi:hypothetical protein